MQHFTGRLEQYYVLLLEEHITGSTNKKRKSSLQKIENQRNITTRWNINHPELVEVADVVLQQRLSDITSQLRLLFANCRFLERCKTQHAGIYIYNQWTFTINGTLSATFAICLT